MRRQTAQFLVCFLVFVALAGCSGKGNIAPVTDRNGRSSASSSRDVWVTVNKGDTLFSISFAHGRDHRTVARLNNIRAPYTIYPGQRIKVSGTPKLRKTYTSKKSKISKKKSVSSSNKKAKRKKTRSLPRSSVKWAWPVRGKIIRSYSVKAARRKGVGIAGELGRAIKAAAAGKVVYSGTGILGYGKLIIVKHNETYLSAYAHSLKVFVKEGQSVTQGQKIASMGNNEAGNPMLHFEIRRNGKPVNPVRYLPER